MPDFGAPVAQNAGSGVGQGIKTLQDLMGLQRTQQQLTSGAIGIQQQQQTLKTGESIQQRAQAEAQQSQLDLLAKGTVAIANRFVPIANKEDLSYDDLVNAAKGAHADMGAPDASLANVVNQLPKNGTPQENRQAAKLIIAEMTGAQHALSLITGQPSSINTGGAVQPGTTAGALQSNAGAFTPSGQPVSATVPPTAPIYTGPKTSPVYAGGTAQGAAPGTVPAGAPMGTQEAAVGAIAPNVTHFAGVQAAAAAAPQRISQLREIKALAPEATTGNAEWKRQLISRFAGFFGVSFDNTTATDEMAKQTAMLAQRAGATDAANALAGMATPNAHMTEKAIQSTANQLIGLESRNVAALKFFGGTPLDSDAYQAKLKVWNSIDPKVFEIGAMPANEQAAAVKALRGTAQGDRLKASMRLLHEAGIQP